MLSFPGGTQCRPSPAQTRAGPCRDRLRASPFARQTDQSLAVLGDDLPRREVRRHVLAGLQDSFHQPVWPPVTFQRNAAAHDRQVRSHVISTAIDRVTLRASADFAAEKIRSPACGSPSPSDSSQTVVSSFAGRSPSEPVDTRGPPPKVLASVRPTPAAAIFDHLLIRWHQCS